MTDDHPRWPSRRAVVQLTDTIGLEVALGRYHARKGFAIYVTRTSVDETHGWNWFDAVVFPGFQGRAGRVWVETDAEKGEITGVHCITDVVLGASSVVTAESSESHDIEVVIAAGSVLRLR